MSARRSWWHVALPRSAAALGVGLAVAWCFCRYRTPDTVLALLTSLSFCN